MSALTSLADGWASLAWAATWQLAALALLAWLAERLLRLRQPRARHALWWFVLLAPLLLAPGRLALERRQAVVRVTPPAPAARMVAEMPRFAMTALPPTREVPAAPALAEEPAAPSGLKVRTVDALALAWFMGCALLTLRLVMGHRRVRRMLAESRPVEDASALEVLRGLCAEAGIRAPVRLRTSGSVGAPVLYGLRRPVIVAPQDWLSSLARDELRALLAHEVAHLRRRDVLANLVQRLIEIPLFFHPLAWLASRRITLAREELCDAWALSQGADPAGYARSLAAAAERAYADGAAASLGVAERRFTLLRRVEAIMSAGSVRRLSRPLAVGLGAVLLAAAAAFAAIQWAREAGQATEGLTAELNPVPPDAPLTSGQVQAMLSRLCFTASDGIAVKHTGSFKLPGNWLRSHPSGLAVDDDGHLYLAYLKRRTVFVFDWRGKLLRRVPVPERDGLEALLHAVAVRGGVVYCLVAPREPIHEFSLVTSQPSLPDADKLIASLPTARFGYSDRMVVSRSGWLYVCNRSPSLKRSLPHPLVQMDAANGNITRIVPGPLGGSLACAPGGGVFVLHGQGETAGTIVHYDASLREQDRFRVPSRPIGEWRWSDIAASDSFLAIAENGVTNSSRSVVFFDHRGEYLGRLKLGAVSPGSSTTLGYLSDLAAHGSRLYLLDWGHKIIFVFSVRIKESLTPNE